jgi:hypothetical protein
VSICKRGYKVVNCSGLVRSRTVWLFVNTGGATRNSVYDYFLSFRKSNLNKFTINRKGIVS